MDKKRIKHLAASVQDLLLTEMKYEDKKYAEKRKHCFHILYEIHLCRKHNEFLTENRHILYHLIDLRQSHIEQFNMFLILLIVGFYFNFILKKRLFCY